MVEDRRHLVGAVGLDQRTAQAVGAMDAARVPAQMLAHGQEAVAHPLADGCLEEQGVFERDMQQPIAVSSQTGGVAVRQKDKGIATTGAPDQRAMESRGDHAAIREADPLVS